MNILKLLQEEHIIDAPLAERVAQEAREKDVSAESLLIEHGVDPDRILATLGAFYKLPTRQLTENTKIDPAVLKFLPEESARHYKMLPLALKDGVLEVGAVDPDELTALDALNFISAQAGVPYKLFVILERDLERGFAMYENLTGEVDEALTELESELADEIGRQEKEKQTQPEEEEEEFIKEDAPVTKIVATILRYAVDGLASDVHIEPVADKVQVRFRIDGMLGLNLELPKKVHTAVVARVKILSTMRLDERRKPQDGRFSAKIDGRKIDFRVSTLPTYYGEKVVMRILDPEKGVKTLEETGVSTFNLEAIRRAVQEPYGIILISGPTGSGKSTTLYSMLGEVDRLGKNVISLEDPVEYNIDGVNQSQVQPEIGYTFASGLRSVLRQDPDVIMVGEIRDKETAQLAIQAALTGHLVLSTIHTNNAVGVIPRLIDMGVDPYLIAPTLTLAMAQRLVRRICPDTGKKIPVEGSMQKLVEHEFEEIAPEYRDRIPKAEYVLEAEPTDECPSGTRGRIAVMEVIEMNEEIEELILSEANEEDIYAVARKNGYISMKEDALMKAIEGVIPFTEVNTLGGTMLDAEVSIPPPAAPEERPAAASPEAAVDNARMENTDESV